MVRSGLLLAAIALMILYSTSLVGCATTQTDATNAKAPTVDLTGTWNGTYAANSGPLPLRLKLQQAKQEVTGEASVSGDGWTVAAFNGGLRGTVSANTFSYSYPGGGADLTVDGREMRGRTNAGHGVLLRRE